MLILQKAVLLLHLIMLSGLRICRLQVSLFTFPPVPVGPYQGALIFLIFRKLCRGRGGEGRSVPYMRPPELRRMDLHSAVGLKNLSPVVAVGPPRTHQ
jgi:hypothetical protein